MDWIDGLEIYDYKWKVSDMFYHFLLCETASLTGGLVDNIFQGWSSLHAAYTWTNTLMLELFLTLLLPSLSIFVYLEAQEWFRWNTITSVKASFLEHIRASASHAWICMMRNNQFLASITQQLQYSIRTQWIWWNFTVTKKLTTLFTSVSMLDTQLPLIHFWYILRLGHFWHSQLPNRPAGGGESSRWVTLITSHHLSKI